MATRFTEKLYEVTERTQERVQVRFTDRTHEVFQAHFPQRPLLPGFLQVDVFAEALGVNVREISSAKFMKIISPEELVTCRYKISDNKLRLELFNEKEELISDIRLHVE